MKIKKIQEMLDSFKQKQVNFWENIAVEKAIRKVMEDRQKIQYNYSHPQVEILEETLAQKLGNIPVLAVNSGTDALILALKVFGIEPGDEIIVPAFSFMSTASCVSWVNATPVFADIRPEDYALDPSAVEQKITKRTKAIIVAHLFGQPALGMARIVTLAKKFGIFIIEDAAQSLMAKLCLDNEWKIVGTIGDVGCLSFASMKILAALGNGGALIINDNTLRQIADKIRFYGAKQLYYEHPVAGVNAKLHEIQAAVLLSRLSFLDQRLAHRAKIAAYYSEQLKDCDDITLPEEHSGTKRVWYRYVVRTPQRDALFDYLSKRLATYNHLKPTKNYPVPLPYFDAFRKLGYRKGNFPVSEQIAAEVLSLPLHNFVSMADARIVCNSIKDFYSN